MALHLYRRHRRDCTGGHAEDSRSGEVEEHRKGWKRCACVIYVSGTLGGHFTRRPTQRTAWDEARAFAVPLETAQFWGRLEAVVPVPVPGAEERAASPPQVAAPPPVEPLPSLKAPPMTIAKAIEAFLTTKKASVAPATVRKHKTFTNQLRAFADGQGYAMLDQFTRVDIDLFYATSTLGPRSKAKMLERLRGFFRYTVNREWLTKSPVSPDLKPPRGSSRPVNKMPFTDEQLVDIIRACDQLEGRRWGNRFSTGEWTGEDVKEFIWVLVYTGLRISDVAMFDIERLHGNEIFLHAKKNGGDVFAYLPDWLRDRLNARAKRCGAKLFLTGRSMRIDTLTEAWRRRINQAFALADVGRDRATPHRFRHTFARILLQKGVPIADVADLLGDDEETVRIHYARWVPERQARLTRILEDAFRDKPKLTALPGGGAPGDLAERSA